MISDCNLLHSLSNGTCKGPTSFQEILTNHLLHLCFCFYVFQIHGETIHGLLMLKIHKFDKVALWRPVPQKLSANHLFVIGFEEFQIYIFTSVCQLCDRQYEFFYTLCFHLFGTLIKSLYVLEKTILHKSLCVPLRRYSKSFLFFAT